MKKLYIITLLLFTLMISPLDGRSQCKHFAKQVCKKELTPFTHNGNYNAAILTEGETAEVYKTFYANQNYRIYICESSVIPKIHFQVLDVNRNVIYDNKNEDFKTKWDFVPESSQQLIISLEVGNSQKDSKDPVSGCVSVMIGVKK